jgi:hypothetical protein
MRPVVANGAPMQMVEGSIPTAPRSSYNGSSSDHGLEGNLVKLLGGVGGVSDPKIGVLKISY